MAVSGKKVRRQFSFSSREDYKIFCQPCDRDDKRLPAFGFCKECQQHLCKTCSNNHKRAKSSRHHTLLDKQNMPQNLQVPSQSVDAGPSDDLTTPCPVNYISDISTYSLDSNEYTKSLHTMDTVIQKYQKIIEELKKRTTASNHSLTGVLQEIKKFRQEINQRLDELEKEAEDMAKARQEENEQRLKTAETTVDDVTKSLKASSDYIKQLNDSKQADKLFMELKHAEQLIKDNEKKISLLASSKDVGEYYFIPNPAIASCLQNEKSLGKLIGSNFSHQEDICVKTSHEARCWITGITLLTPSKLLLIDQYNSSIKMADLNNNSITNQLQLANKPWDIASVASDQAAVTLPYMETIQFISASSNKLSLEHKLKVEGMCHGISCYQDKLVATFVYPGKLQILNLKGKVLSTVTTDRSGENIFSIPQYVTSNRHCIYVSDEVKHTVIRLNWKGKLKGSYGGMDDPEGLTMLEDGSILVCDYNNDNIHHISGDLTKDNVVLRNLKKALVVCWCGTNNNLYISRDRSDVKYENFIQVFKRS